jgi:hypothetical protein
LAGPDDESDVAFRVGADVGEVGGNVQRYPVSGLVDRRSAVLDGREFGRRAVERLEADVGGGVVGLERADAANLDALLEQPASVLVYDRCEPVATLSLDGDVRRDGQFVFALDRAEFDDARGRDQAGAEVDRTVVDGDVLGGTATVEQSGVDRGAGGRAADIAGGDGGLDDPQPGGTDVLLGGCDGTGDHTREQCGGHEDGDRTAREQTRGTHTCRFPEVDKCPVRY